MILGLSDIYMLHKDFEKNGPIIVKRKSRTHKVEVSAIIFRSNYS